MNFECLGDVASWGEGILPRVYVSPHEVYLWRANLSGVNFQEPRDALLFVQAIGKKIAGFDIRGICVVRGESSSVDVVFTAGSYILDFWDNAEDIKKFVAEDMDLRARFPGISVTGSGLFQLTGPPSSVDFWVEAPVVWSNSVGPQQAFRDLQGVYEGVADEGLNLKNWKASVILGPPTGKKEEPSQSSSGAVIWIIGGILALALISAKVSKHVGEYEHGLRM